MEKSSFESFQAELSQIKDYIKHIKQVNDLMSVDIIQNSSVFQIFRTHFILFQTDKKIFEYKAIIISLYGLFEKYIELWVKEYLECLSRVFDYNKLSDNIKNKHFELSMKLIGIVVDGRYAKYSSLKKEDILYKLNKCITNNQLYDFNLDAFTMQSGNLTHSRIEEIFKTIDIIISKELIKNIELVILTELSVDQIQNKESSVIFAKVNELVERRNAIAHGAIIDNLLGLSELERYIEFLEKYCFAIFGVLDEMDIRNHTIEKYQQVSCKGVFSGKEIIGVSIENYTIKTGDWIIIETVEKGNKHFYKKEIKSLGKSSQNDYSERLCCTNQF